MKRVAIITPGGVARAGSSLRIPALMMLLERLSKHYDLTLYLLSRLPEHPREFHIGGILVRTLPAAHADNVWKKAALLLPTLRTDHKKDAYQLIHGIWGFPGGWAAVVAGKFLGLPQLVSLQGGEAANVPAIQYGNLYHRRLRRLTLWTCRQATALTALTNYQRLLLDDSGIVRPDVEIIPYGVPPGQFPAVERTPAAPYQFIHVGNLTEVKDQATLLRAFAIISARVDARLTIIGPDYFKGQIQRLSGELGLAHLVTFTGQVPNEALVAYYHQAHMMLHTSLYEGQAVVLAEAAATGLPIGGTRVGLLADWGEERAVVVEPGDFKSLADGVLKVLSSELLYERLRERAGQWAQIHTADWTAGRYLRLYERLLK